MAAARPPQRQIISRIPQRGMTPEQWGASIQFELVPIWIDALSRRDREKVLAAFEQRSLDSLPSNLFAKLDSIIVHQAETLGWRMTLSELVRFRMSVWDLAENGPEMFRKLGLALARSARRMQRKELAPIEDPDQRLVKHETVQELRLVLSILRTHFSTIQKRPEQVAVLKKFENTILDSSQSFGHLRANLDRWLKFFEENEEAIRRPVVLRVRSSPASLYDEFLSWCTGWQQESVRQAISKLPRIRS